MQRIMKMAALLALVAVAGCGGYDSTSPGGTYNGGGGGGTGGNNGSTSNSITVNDDYFNPSSTTVAVGTTVTWTWNTGTTHNVTFQDGQTSGDMSGGTFTRTFNTAGTFNYQCTIHAGMTGSIVVQ